MKTYINQLGLRGFKSFNRKCDLPFGPSMNCIIGPNGSGKSNVGDAICFILGRLSSKDLRADNYSELVFKKKGGSSASEAEVYLQLDNSSKIFPIDSRTIEIKRKIKKSGQTQYKLNGRNATRQQVLELLTPHRIHPDGHNIILQGDIARFVDMRPIEKRQVVEEVAGIGIYEERKQKALNELGKVEEKLKEAQIIVTEKETFLRALEKDKEEAEKFRTAKDQLEATKATEIHLRIVNAEKRRDSSAANMEKCAKDIEKHTALIEKLTSNISELKNQISDIDKNLEQRGGEEAIALQKAIENLKIETQRSKTLVETSQNELVRFESRKADLQKNLAELDEKIKTKQEEKAGLERDLKEISGKSDKGKKAGAMEALQVSEQKLEDIEKQLEDLQKNKSEFSEQFQNTQTEIKLIESQLGNSAERLDELSKGSSIMVDVDSSKKRYRDIVNEINKIASQDSKLALKLGELKKMLIKREEDFAKARVHAGSAQELLMRDAAIKTILGKKMPGVLGTVTDLGKVEDKFANALKVAAGGRMKNLVVETPDIAIKCLGILKQSRAGIATFLPLSKLRAPAQTELPSKKGVHGFAADLISADKKYKQLFRYVFGNTIVVEDVDTAKSLGVGTYRMVTLEGDLFELSGAITGGFRRSDVGLGFESKDSGVKLDEMESAASAIKNEMKALEEQRGKIDIDLINLRKEKIELESRIELSQKMGGKDQKKEIENKIKELTVNKKKFEGQLASLEKEIKKVGEKIEKSLSEKNSLRAKIKELRESAQSTEIADKQNQLQRDFAILKSELENVLLPEKDDTIKVLKTLEKEAGQFKKQISEEESKCRKIEKELGAKEKEAQSSYQKLRDFYAKKGKLGEEVRGEEDKLLEAKAQLNRVEQEKNNITVNKAQFEAELAGLKEEFQPFEKIQILDSLKTIEEAKKKIRYLEQKIVEMGNVNLKALEAYEEVKKEYEQLAWKLSKLTTEKNDVLDIIGEIEKKKKDAFMKTFVEIAGNFSGIFSKIADKHIAELSLENQEMPFDGGVNVAVTDSKGKKISLASLSGGEKVLVALAFLFAIQEHEPAPFYLFDEIDAALDKVNSEKVASLLKEYGKKAQIIVISHNDAVISEADALYGVSMNKNTGESNIVSLKI